MLERKLHLGCGNVHIPGYTNIDIKRTAATDMVGDVRDLKLPFESFDLIYACAVLEHFGRNEWRPLLRHWVSLLAPGGTLRISTSDFEACCTQYQKTGNLEQLLGLLIGGQKDRWDWHGVIFDFKMLSAALSDLGMINIRRYDWRLTDYGQLGIDDYSQAYIPHMDKDKGSLMVLNVEATKAPRKNHV